MNIRLINELAEKKNLSINKLAAKCEIKNQTLYSNILSNDMTCSRLERIAKVLEVPPATFFDDSGPGDIYNVKGKKNVAGHGNQVVQDNNFFSDQNKHLKQRITDLEQIIGAKDELIRELRGKIHR